MGNKTGKTLDPFHASYGSRVTIGQTSLSCSSRIMMSVDSSRDMGTEIFETIFDSKVK